MTSGGVMVSGTGAGDDGARIVVAPMPDEALEVHIDVGGREYEVLNRLPSPRRHDHAQP